MLKQFLKSLLPSGIRRTAAWLLTAALAVSAAACQSAAPGQSSMPDALSAATMSRYREGEVREYKGARLDPAVGPRDNSISGIQQIDINQYTLSVDGLTGNGRSFAYDEVLKFPAYERLIRLYCVEGWDAQVLWKGVRLTDLIEAAGGAREEANTVIFHAADGYTTSLPLSVIEAKELILAYEANGLPLPPSMGYPFIVVAEDKLGYKWARWVTRIELSDDQNYRGYWEQRGYNNNADLD